MEYSVGKRSGTAMSSIQMALEELKKYPNMKIYSNWQLDQNSCGVQPMTDEAFWLEEKYGSFSYLAEKRHGVSMLTTALAVEEFFHPTVSDRTIRRMQAMADALPTEYLLNPQSSHCCPPQRFPEVGNGLNPR